MPWVPADLEEMDEVFGGNEVTELREGTFYANLILKGADGEVPVDARPSDAIALAVRNHASIFVHEDVIEEVVPI